MSVNSIKIKSGINLHYLHTNKFKTTTLGVYIHRPLTKDEATKNALLSMVLRRGCVLFPDSRSLAKQLDELYGATLETGVRKKGDSQIININLSFANEKFINNSEPILESILTLADSMILKQTHFSKEYVEQEKENLKTLILSQINDKRQYASLRCTEEMCKNEPNGIDRYGFIDDIDGIDENILYEHYKNTFLTSPMDIFMCGEVDIFWVEQRLVEIFATIEVKNSKYPKISIIKNVAEVKNITETEQIAQAKLSMGFRTKVEPNDANYPALLIYNAVLGSGTYSKLFNNVREKLSLAYYVSSNTDYLKGIMLINSGIEVANYQKAYDEIMVQMNAVKNGDISDEEMQSAILATVNSIKSLTDNAVLMEDYYLSKLIAGNIIDIDELVELVSAITKEQVIEVAKDICLDTVYFLKGSEA